MTTDHRTDVVAGLVARADAHSRAVIDAELRRLARRSPSLRQHDLDLVDQALHDIAEYLILSRLRTAPPAQAAQLRHLFRYRTADT